MKIYSWNMLYRNEELDRAFEFIAKSDFDIFCLQEVTDGFLKRLETLPCSIVSRVERELKIEGAVVRNSVVILSKHKVTGQGEVPHREYWKTLPLRTRLFVSLMPSQLFTKVSNRRDLYADITIGGRSVRVFNLHLILAYPALRLKEFEEAMAACDKSRPTIVCGDFNILETLHITPLNWLLGGRIGDAFLYARERKHIEKSFAAHSLQNPLRGRVTHPLSTSQLDHILVSPEFSVRNVSVLPDRMGSDHHPVCVEVE